MREKPSRKKRKKIEMRKMSMEQGEKCPLYEEGGCVSGHRKLKLLQNKKPTKILKRCWRAVIPELQGTVGNLPKVSREGLHGCPPEGSPRPHSYAHHRVHCDAVGKWIQLLPLVQSAAILLFQSLHCSEVHTVECVLGSWSCLAFCRAWASQHFLSL